MNEDMVEAVFDWINEMRAGNLRFITNVPNISLPHLEAWSHIKAWSEAPASIRGNTVYHPPWGSWVRPGGDLTFLGNQNAPIPGWG